MCRKPFDSQGTRPTRRRQGTKEDAKYEIAVSKIKTLSTCPLRFLRPASIVLQESVKIIAAIDACVLVTIAAAEPGVATPAMGSFRVLRGLSMQRRF